MERLIEKARDLEKEVHVKVRDFERELQIYSKQQKQVVPVNPRTTEAGVAQSADWLGALKAACGDWTGRPLVVLSLFDGVGGVWNALGLLGIPFVGYSSEVNPSAIEVLKARYPDLHHLGDVKKVDKESIACHVDLVVGGFPCQDLSCMGLKVGLHGHRSKLFFEMLRIIKNLKPKWFLVENVASMTWVDRDEITRHLRVTPIEIDSQELTPTKRKRLYWSNILYPKVLPKVKDHESTALQSVLHNATALDTKISCILSTNTYNGSSSSLALVMDNSTKLLRYLSVSEAEKVLGYPLGYTDVRFKDGGNKRESSLVIYKPETNEEFEIKTVKRTAGGKDLRSRRIVKAAPQNIFPQASPTRPVAQGSNRAIRWSLLGNSFSVQVIAHLLSPLLENGLQTPAKSVRYSRSVLEKDCSAMEPGDVWALYNDEERPNWYAVILSRTGGRFSRRSAGKKQSPVQIVVKFMEMTKPYVVGENGWCPNRGTGMFQLRATPDVQDSWVTFSHRVTSFHKFDDQYFIFPGKDEVWAVYDRNAGSRYFVYILDSNLDKHKAQIGKPGKEDFSARCCFLRQTVVDHETYELLEDKDFVCKDLQAFAFRAPYVFKNEQRLLKIEISSRNRKQSFDTDRRKPKRKRHNKSDESSSAESEQEQDDTGGVETPSKS